MNVLLIGANGYLGPHVVKALAPHHHLRITDVKPAPAEIKARFAGHEFMNVDVTSLDQVMATAEGMDAIVNLSVVRHDPALAFRVNTLGCNNMMRAAVRHRIQRVINTGPHFTIAGPSYERFDHAISPDLPPHPGAGLYPLTKSLGQEICRAFTLTHDIYVQDYLFYSLRDAEQLKPGAGGVPFVVSWGDAAEGSGEGAAKGWERAVGWVAEWAVADARCQAQGRRHHRRLARKMCRRQRHLRRHLPEAPTTRNLKPSKPEPGHPSRS